MYSLPALRQFFFSAPRFTRAARAVPRPSQELLSGVKRVPGGVKAVEGEDNDLAPRVTRLEVAQMGTKEDIKDLKVAFAETATKQEAANAQMATKDDIKDLKVAFAETATKQEVAMAQLGSKLEVAIAHMATKDDMKKQEVAIAHMATKDDMKKQEVAITQMAAQMSTKDDFEDLKISNAEVKTTLKVMGGIAGVLSTVASVVKLGEVKHWW